MAGVRKQITVEQVGKFGVKVNGEWWSISKKGGPALTEFAPGGSYWVDVYTADSGKNFINSVEKENPYTPPSASSTMASTAFAASDTRPVYGTDKPVDKPVYDADKKQRQIQAQGTIQAAVQAPALTMFATSYEEWISLVKKTALESLQFIRENS